MPVGSIYSGQSDTGIVQRNPQAWGQGSIGRVNALTIHHTAGPRARNKAEAVRLNRRYDQEHAAKGWGGIGYHFTVDDHGRFYRCRPSSLRGAHTGGHNTGNIGVSFHGNFDTGKPTWRQRRALKWLMRGGFYKLTRISESKLAYFRGHQEWPGPTNSTACPGKWMMRSLRYRRDKDFR